MKTTFFTACLLMAATSNAVQFYKSGYNAYADAMHSGANERAIQYRVGGQLMQQTSRAKFHEWLAMQNKHYTSNDEYMEAMFNWMVVEKLINEQNFKADQSGDPDFLRLGHNFFSDWSSEEKARHNFGMIADHATEGGSVIDFGEWEDHFATQSWVEAMEVDWVEAGKVTEVKSQGACGSCYAFSAFTTLEAAIAIADDRDPVRISEQQVLDCYDCCGCSGAWMDWVWSAARDGGGVVRDQDYKYSASENQCNIGDIPKVAGVTDWGYINGNPYEMVKALQIAPLAISMTTRCDAFYQYSSGIIKIGDCPYQTLTHAVVITAFKPNGATGEEGSVEGGTPYFHIQNSWGSWWGDNGFFKVEVDWNDYAGVLGVHEYAMWVKGETLNVI